MPDNSVGEIKLRKGDSTTVKLKGLATAGYEWTYTADNDYVKISKEFAPYDGNDKVHGSSADEIFTLTAQQKGTTTVHFIQQRSWKKDTTVNEKNIKITVEE